MDRILVILGLKIRDRIVGVGWGTNFLKNVNMLKNINMYLRINLDLCRILYVRNRGRGSEDVRI
jgi:hypothetical protein